jgi:predicted GNAT superfamily acetyltransferase
MSPPWTLRSATPEDHQPMLAVVDDWWGKPMVALLPRLFLDHFHTTSFVAETDDGQMVGLLVGFFSQADPTAAYVHFVAVSPERRGDGLARTLYEAFFDLARADGRSQVTAITSASNDVSIAYHSAMGFEVIGPLADYDYPGHQAIKFHRPL